MLLRRGLFVGLSGIALVALWLLIAGPSKVVGVDPGNTGTLLLVAAAWGSLFALSRVSTGGLAREMAPGELKAWIGLGFTVSVLAYAIGQAHVFDGPAIPHNPDANRVGRNIALLVAAWAIVSQVVKGRWRQPVQRDERDLEIAANAGQWARLGLSAYAIGVAVLLGFSPAEKLSWAPPPMIAHLLVLGLIGSCALEYGATAVSYWRDRH